MKVVWGYTLAGVHATLPCGELLRLYLSACFSLVFHFHSSQ